MALDSDETKAKLGKLRQAIDGIDNEILDVLVRRFEVTKAVGLVKKEGGLSAEDPAREEQMYQRLRASAAQRNLEPDVIEDVYRALLTHVKRQHRSL